MIKDGVVKILYLVRCYNFFIITTYRMYAVMKEKLHASSMKIFTYPLIIEVFTNWSLKANVYFSKDRQPVQFSVKRL